MTGAFNQHSGSDSIIPHSSSALINLNNLIPALSVYWLLAIVVVSVLGVYGGYVMLVKTQASHRASQVEPNYVYGHI